MSRGFSIGEAIGAPFRLAFAKPLSTLAWGLVMLAPSVVMIAALAPLWALALETGDTGPLTGETGIESFDDLGAYLKFQAWNGLANLLSLLATLLVTTAVIRATLAGHRGDGAAFLRFSRDEFHEAVIGMAVVVGLVAVWLIVGGLAVGLGVAAGVGGQSMVWAAWAAGGLGLLLFVVTVLVWGRLSLIAPVAVITRTLAFEEGWRAGRGQTGKLFLLMLCLFAITLLIGLVVLALVLGVAGGLAAGLGPWPDEVAVEAWLLARAADPWPVVWAGLALLPVTGWLIGLGQALVTAPFAVAARGLVPGPRPLGADAPGQAG